MPPLRKLDSGSGGVINGRNKNSNAVSRQSTNGICPNIATLASFNHPMSPSAGNTHTHKTTAAPLFQGAVRRLGNGPSTSTESISISSTDSHTPVSAPSRPKPTLIVSPRPHQPTSNRTQSSSSGRGGAARDLLAYIQKQCEKDVRIVCEGKTFTVNSVILSARSQVFHRMLQGEFIEGRSRTINIKDAVPYVVENFVDALTCDSCQILREGHHQFKSLVTLYMLADRFQFTSLTKKCEVRIGNLVRKDNVLDVLDAADQTNNTWLRRRCMEKLQSMRGAELLSMLRGGDMWEDLRDMRINIEASMSATRPLSNPTPSVDSTRSKASVLCCEHDTVEGLKRIISSTWPIRVDKQRLVFMGKPLDDERTLQESGITANATVFVLECTRHRQQDQEVCRSLSLTACGDVGVTCVKRLFGFDDDEDAAERQHSDDSKTEISTLVRSG